MKARAKFRQRSICNCKGAEVKRSEASRNMTNLQQNCPAFRFGTNVPSNDPRLRVSKHNIRVSTIRAIRNNSNVGSRIRTTCMYHRETVLRPILWMLAKESTCVVHVHLAVILNTR